MLSSSRILVLHHDPTYMTEIAQDIYGGDLQSNPEFIRHMAHATHNNEPLSYIYQLMAAKGWTSLPWLRLLRQPTLIPAGDDDPIVPAINARIMHQLIPHSKLHIYHGGHLGLLTHAPELTVLIQEFLSAEVNTHNSSLMSSLRLSWRYMMRQALPFFSAYSQ